MKKKTTIHYPFLALTVLALTALVFVSTAHAQAGVAIGGQLQFGSRGSDVSTLQTFLATDAAIYPEGLVTGYYGSLTVAAVQRYQCSENIVCSGSAGTTGYGRVGPVTLARINAALAAGGTLGAPDATAPINSNVTVVAGQNAATVYWTTNESAKGKVYYNTVFPAMFEGTPSAVSSPFVESATFTTAHSISLPNLAANTPYFYVVQSTDASGNVQFTWPAMFTTR